MKAMLLVWMCLLLAYVSQAQWQDDFSDGDFTSNPAWSGDDAMYSAANGMLQLNNPAPLGASQPNFSALHLPSSLDNLNNIEWRFFLDHGFAGSDNNQTRVYIAADGPPILYSGTGSAGVAGYFLLFGEAGTSDVVRFYYDDGSNVNLIGSGTTLIAGSFNVSMRVVRDNAANWTIEADFAGGQNYTTEASFNDNSISTSTYFGFINKYTSSNASNIALDNFYVGPIVVDNDAPGVLSATATSLSTIDVLFNEPLNASSATNAAHYTIVNIGNALSATICQDRTVHEKRVSAC